MAAALARLSCTFFLLFAPLALAQQQDFARLVAYPKPGCTSICAPLILIYGIHGTGVDSGCEIDAVPRAADGKPADFNWWPLIDYLRSATRRRFWGVLWPYGVLRSAPSRLRSCEIVEVSLLAFAIKVSGC